MNLEKDYLFTSQRLGFRNWHTTDEPEMMLINSDPEVMEFFPGTYDKGQTKQFIRRMQSQFVKRGYCYFAVDRLDQETFIGFIGLSWQTYDAPFTPCVDIGWRLKKEAWNNGFAKEGAARCLEYGFQRLGLTSIYAIAPKVNLKSEHIMKAIGMKKLSEFQHPLLLEDDRLRDCLLYSIQNGRPI